MRPGLTLPILTLAAALGAGAPAAAAGLEGDWSALDAGPGHCFEGMEGWLSVGRDGFVLGETHCAFAPPRRAGFPALDARAACVREGASARRRVVMRRAGARLSLAFDGGPAALFRRCPARP